MFQVSRAPFYIYRQCGCVIRSMPKAHGGSSFLQGRMITTTTRRQLSTSSSTSTEDEIPDNMATIVQGPSFLSSTGIHRPNPSMFILPGLRSLPFWTSQHNKDGTIPEHHRSGIAYNDPIVKSIVQHVESNAEHMRKEYMDNAYIKNPDSTGEEYALKEDTTKSLKPDYDLSEKGGEHASGALHSGQWDWHSFILNGERQPQFAEFCPQTAKCLDDIANEGHLFDSTPFSFAFFSTLHGSASIKAHNGPMNLRLRVHLPLFVPQGNGKCGIQVGDQTRSWVKDRAMVLDDSYTHEVWNETSEPRVLLLFDIWHPDVRPDERQRINEMFSYAKSKGWLGKKQGNTR